MSRSIGEWVAPRCLLRRAGLAALVVALVSLSGPLQAAVPIQSFLASPAAVAFKAGDFEIARQGFEGMLAEHPEDPLVLRYLAITYDRLDRLDEAITTFKRALEIAPDNAALNLFLGMSYWKARRAEEATAAMQRTIELAPGSPYEDKARDYLAAMEHQRSRNDTVGAPRTWQLSLQGGVQRDDNVSLGSPGLESPDVRFYQSASGGYILYDSDGLRLNAKAFTYLSEHARRKNHDFNVALIEPALELSYVDTLWALPVSTSLRYAYAFVALDGATFSQSHGIEPAVAFRPHSQLLTRLHNRVVIEEFADAGFDADITSRDGITNRTGITQYVFCCGQEHYLFGSYEFLRKFAEGDNLDRRGHRLALGASAALPYAFRLDLSGEVVRERYDNFVSFKDRKTDRHGVSAAVTRPLLEGLTMSLSFSYTNEDSNFPALDYERTIFGANLAYRF